jgi:hypothetical protein
MARKKKLPEVASRVIVQRIGREQRDGRCECKLQVLFEGGGDLRVVYESKRMCLRAERVEALEGELATAVEVDEGGVDARLEQLAARERCLARDVASVLNRARLEGGGLTNAVGKWQGALDRERLMGHGFVVAQGLLGARLDELGALLAAGRKAFKLTRAGLLVSRAAWQHNDAWDKVHAEHPRVGALGARSVKPAEAMKALTATERRRAEEGLRLVLADVAARAGHEADDVADVAFLGYWAGMVPQAWHLDGEPRLAFVVALREMVATEFLVPPEGFRWKDTLALARGVREAFRRRVFALVEEDEMCLTGGAGVARVSMRAGDVCFFYTHWLHRAPAPPVSMAEEARVCLFGVFGKEGASEGKPIFRHHILGE